MAKAKPWIKLSLNGSYYERICFNYLRFRTLTFPVRISEASFFLVLGFALAKMARTCDAFFVFFPVL